MAKKKKDLDLASSSHLNQIQGSTNAIFNVIFVILALACIIPVVFIFMISISSEHSIKMNGYQFIPSAYSLDSYKFLLSGRTDDCDCTWRFRCGNGYRYGNRSCPYDADGLRSFQKHLQTERILHHGRFYSNDLQWWYDFFLCS